MVAGSNPARGTRNPLNFKGLLRLGLLPFWQAKADFARFHKRRKAVAKHTGPKGNLQFPLDEPIPYDLIERVVKLRVKQDRAKAAAKRKMRK